MSNESLVTVAFASLIIILSIKYPHLMLNPGELSNSHQNLKKEKCTSCHSYFSGIDYQKCVECHNLKLIGIDTINNQKLTGNVEKISFHDKLVDQNCTNCHSDHNGIVPKSFLNSFDHTYLKPEIHDKCVSCHAKPDDSLHSHLKI
ncbi:MAG: hypothetical protein IPH84_04125 [Bacteroidales bacterium]|nr:hypothetical protein [Bacteroidales bacterium]